jgi:hypothetical protein
LEASSWSGVEGREVEAGEPGGVAEDVHGRDPPVLQREGGDREDLSVEERDPAGRAVDVRRRPRLASWRAASGERSRTAPISSNATENMSWTT